MAERIWLDVDTSNGVVDERPRDVDDGLAMIFAFASPEVEVRGVSVCFGNVGLNVALPITREVVRRFGPTGMGVFSGAASGAELGRETEATRALTAELERCGEKGLTIVALGPVTNVATVVKNRPELRGRIGSIVLCAARRTGFDFHIPGRPELKFPDANFEKDVEGMRVLLESGVELVFVGYESSCDSWLTRADMRKWAEAGEGGRWVAETSEAWLARWESVLKQDGFNPFDVVTLGWMTHREMMTGHAVSSRIVFGPDDRGRERLAADRGEKAYLVCDPVGQAGATGGRQVYVTKVAADFGREIARRIGVHVVGK